MCKYSKEQQKVHLVQSSFPLIHKVANIVIFLLLM